MSLIAAGVIMAVSGGLQVASALETRKEANKDKKAANRIAAAENENAQYAGILEKRRVGNQKQYEPGYGLMADEVQKKPILLEQAIPLTGSIIAAEDSFRKQNLPATDLSGTDPGSARRAAIDLGSSTTAAGQIIGQTQQLKTGLDSENFNQRKQAIDIGKQYVGS